MFVIIILFLGSNYDWLCFFYSKLLCNVIYMVILIFVFLVCWLLLFWDLLEFENLGIMGIEKCVIYEYRVCMLYKNICFVCLVLLVFVFYFIYI